MAVWYAALCGQILTFITPDLASVQVAESSQSFPCADHACGCDSAAVCFSACCCYPKVATPPSCGNCDEEPTPASTQTNPAFSAVLCLGLPDAPALSLPGLSKHLSGAHVSITAPQTRCQTLDLSQAGYTAPTLDPPDKVPLTPVTTT